MATGQRQLSPSAYTHLGKVLPLLQGRQAGAERPRKAAVGIARSLAAPGWGPCHPLGTYGPGREFTWTGQGRERGLTLPADSACDWRGQATVAAGGGLVRGGVAGALAGRPRGVAGAVGQVQLLVSAL